MSTIVDNIILALLSLKEDLTSYLNDSGWQNKYSIFLAGDQEYSRKEVVENMIGKDPRRYVGLPLITIETGNVRNEILELGNIDGKDVLTVTLLVRAVDSVQLATLGNAIRRRLTDLIFTVYNYQNSNKEFVGMGRLERTVLDDISNWNSDSWAEKHVALINTTLEIDSQSYT